MNFLRSFSLGFFLLLCGCQTKALVVHQQKVGPKYLASAHVGSPEPLAPPKGQMLIAEWWISPFAMKKSPVLVLDLVFNNFTTKQVSYPIRSTFGYETYEVLGGEFKSTKGLLSYKAQILLEDGEIYAEWTHQLYVKLITVEEDKADRRSSAAEVKSRQGSVIDTPFCKADRELGIACLPASR